MCVFCSGVSFVNMVVCLMILVSVLLLSVLIFVLSIGLLGLRLIWWYIFIVMVGLLFVSIFIVILFLCSVVSVGVVDFFGGLRKVRKLCMMRLCLLVVWYCVCLLLCGIVCVVSMSMWKLFLLYVVVCLSSCLWVM